jgi:hypothetical protein
MPRLALRFRSNGRGDSDCARLNPATECEVNDSSSANPTQTLEQRKLIGITNGLTVDGRDHVTGKKTRALRGTAGREPLHVNPAVGVSSRGRMVKKTKSEPAGASGGGRGYEKSEDQQNGTHFPVSL